MLGIEVEDARTLGRFYVAVVQAVLMYGLETWVMTPFIGRTLSIFYHRVDHRLTRSQRGVESMGGGGIPRWWRRWRRWGYRGWRPTSPAARTQLHSSLQPITLCTCVWRRRGVQGHECPRGCGRSKAWTWWGFIWRIRRRNGRRGRRIRIGWRRRWTIN